MPKATWPVMPEPKPLPGYTSPHPLQPGGPTTQPLSRLTAGPPGLPGKPRGGRGGPAPGQPPLGRLHVSSLTPRRPARPLLGGDHRALSVSSGGLLRGPAVQPDPAHLRAGRVPHVPAREGGGAAARALPQDRWAPRPTPSWPSLHPHPHPHPKDPGRALTWLSSPRSGCHDVVPSGLRHRLWKVRRRHPALLESVPEGKGGDRRFVEARPWSRAPFPGPLHAGWLRLRELRVPAGLSPWVDELPTRGTGPGDEVSAPPCAPLASSSVPHSQPGSGPQVPLGRPSPHTLGPGLGRHGFRSCHSEVTPQD